MKNVTTLKNSFFALHDWISNHFKLTLLVLVLLTLVERFFVLWNFGFNFSDNDQMVLWQTAIDMSQGNFFSATFYGQSYNPNIEPLFAVPFIWLGIHPTIALPITTSIILISSFALFSYTLSKQEKIYALIPWFILLALPITFHMFTTMPRGWVGSLLTTSVSYWAFQRFKNKGIAAFFASFTLWFNPAFIIILIALFFESFFNLEKKEKFNIILGFILGLTPNIASKMFFIFNPELIVSPSPSLSFSTNLWSLRMSRLDSDYFRTITPYLWRNGVFTILFLLFFAWRTRKTNLTKALAYVLCFIVFFLFTFVETMNNVSNSIYITGGRYFLFYPFLFCLFIIEFYQIYRNSLQFFILYACILSISKIFTHDKQIVKYNTSFEQNDIRLSFIAENKSFKTTCEELADFSKGAEIIIGMGICDYKLHYGCPIYIPQQKFWIKDDRRTFESQVKLNTKVDTFMLHAIDSTEITKLNLSGFEIIQKHIKYSWLMLKAPEKMYLKDIVLNLKK